MSKNLYLINMKSIDPNPGKRHSIWSLIIGGYFTWVTIYGVNQSQVQRYLTVPTIKQARKYDILQYCNKITI